MLSIGLMSGTSMDGIDAALIETDGETTVAELGNISVSYTPEFKILLKAAEYAVKKSKGNLAAASSYYPAAVENYLQKELQIAAASMPEYLTQLSTQVPINYDAVIRHSTDLHARAVKELLTATKQKPEHIHVVGYHGQTLYHAPAQRMSVQAGDGKYLAEQIGITVINDFRRADVEMGGEGAPFAPLYHLALAIRDKMIPVIIVNCGGIANITAIRNSNSENLIGYDTGPGNALIDRLVKQRTQGKEAFDADGKYGNRGKVHEAVLEKLYSKSILKEDENYLYMLPPKSLDYNDMVLIPELDVLSLEDACATLEAFTADTIITSVDMLAIEIPKHWVLAGGGWNNPVIKREFESRLRKKYGDDVKIHTADEIQWNSKALEAQIFAYLAVRSLQGKAISVPGTTHVPVPLTGGQIHVATI